MIITREGATVAFTVTYLNPIVAIILGVAVLSETMTGDVQTLFEQAGCSGQKPAGWTTWRPWDASDAKNEPGHTLVRMWPGRVSRGECRVR